jgi:hypothetical protein
VVDLMAWTRRLAGLNRIVMLHLRAHGFLELAAGGEHGGGVGDGQWMKITNVPIIARLAEASRCVPILC